MNRELWALPAYGIITITINSDKSALVFVRLSVTSGGHVRAHYRAGCDPSVTPLLDSLLEGERYTATIEVGNVHCSRSAM